TWRRTWPLVVGVAAAAYAVNIPWRIWWSVRHLTPDTPDNGLGHFTGSLGRVLPSLRIVFEVTFDYKLWLLAVPIAAIAALAAFAARETRAQAMFFLATGVAVILAFTWVIWSDPTLPLSTVPSLTPIPRAMGSLAFLSLALAPVLTTGLAGGGALPVLDRTPRDVLSGLRGAGD